MTFHPIFMHVYFLTIILNQICVPGMCLVFLSIACYGILNARTFRHMFSRITSGYKQYTYILSNPNTIFRRSSLDFIFGHGPSLIPHDPGSLILFIIIFVIKNVSITGIVLF